MTRTKILLSIGLASVFLFTQIIAVGAAPANQDTPPIVGTVEQITIETDGATGTTTILVTLIDEMGVTQTVRLSLEGAIALDLVLDGESINPDAIGTLTEIDPAQVVPVGPAETEVEAQHPVGSALANFFSELLGVEYETIMEYHNDGVGFGVIAQALWMTNALEGDSDIFAAIVEAKQNHDYSEITLPDGSTPQNWGQFRKAVLQDRKKSKENLGAIMSGRAGDGQGNETQPGSQTIGNDNKPDKDKAKNKAKNNDKGNNGNGQNKNKGNNK